MQSEFENVIGVFLKSVADLEGVRGLQVPCWNPFSLSLFLNVKSTVKNLANAPSVNENGEVAGLIIY